MLSSEKLKEYRLSAEQRLKDGAPIWHTTTMVDGVLYPEIGPEMSKVEKDMVNHPSHYTFGKIECIDALESMCSPEEFLAFLRLTIVQYLWRAGRKHNTAEDIEKADFYIQKLKEKAREYERKNNKDSIQGTNNSQTTI